MLSLFLNVLFDFSENIQIFFNFLQRLWIFVSIFGKMNTTLDIFSDDSTDSYSGYRLDFWISETVFSKM